MAEKFSYLSLKIQFLMGIKITIADFRSRQPRATEEVDEENLEQLTIGGRSRIQQRGDSE